MTEAVELPRSGPGFARYRPFGSRNFGTAALVRSIMRAAAEVDRLAPFGQDLLVGDISALYGGKVTGHASHRSGRDVDLLYYVTSADGVPVRSPGFIHFGADGLAPTSDRRFLALDVRREWLLIRALLTDPDAEVLWIFTSRDVEALITDYARSLGEPAELVARAIQVMHQPRDSANHDDHLHVRFACSAEEQVAGCDLGGPAWPWLRVASGSRGAPTAEELAALADESAL